MEFYTIEGTKHQAVLMEQQIDTHFTQMEEVKQIIAKTTTRARRPNQRENLSMQTLNIPMIALQIAISDKEGKINPLKLFLEFAQTAKNGCIEKGQVPHFNSRDFKNYLNNKFDQIYQAQNLAVEDKAETVKSWYRITEKISGKNKNSKISLFFRKEKTAIDKEIPRCNPTAKTHKNIYYFSKATDGKKLVFESILDQINLLNKI